MAIDRFSAESLLLLRELELPLDRMLLLGRQHLVISDSDRSYLEREYPEARAVLDQVPSNEEIFAEPFLYDLGAEKVESMDFSDYQGSTLQHDLNLPIPEEWHHQHDVVFDGGTLEHVFHFPNAISNAMNLVAMGGCLVCCTTTNNYNGHGFYQFSPELHFRLFDGENGFSLRLLALAESGDSPQIIRVEDPKTLGHRVTFGGNSPLLMITIAERVETVPALQTFPQQSDYQSNWNSTARSSTTSPTLLYDSRNTLSSTSRKCLRNVLPEAWLERYRRFRFQKRIAKHSEKGISRVKSLKECIRNLQK